MECELLRSPMISYRSLPYNTTVLYDKTYVFEPLGVILNFRVGLKPDPKY